MSKVVGGRMGLALAALLFASAGAAAWTGPSPIIQPPPSGDSSPPAPLSDLFTDQEKDAQYRAFARAAAPNGYDIAITEQPDPRLVVFTLTKTGETSEGHGIFNTRWAQKDIITVTIRKQHGSISANATREIQVKPPLGSWIKQSTNEIPGWVFVPQQPLQSSG